MRVWLYGRLSNDDDVMMNSLENQLEIVRAFASERGYQIIGESYDDNVSGMRFDRKGLNQVTQAVDAGKIDAVIVKDLSRLGRHQTQTALFIDYLRQCSVAVLSVT
ncbi:MAG: recombinase family protein, partial [Faecousia sp.]